VRAYVTITDGNMDLLPYFCRYFAEHGVVDEIFLTVFGTVEHQRIASCYIHDAGLELTLGKLFTQESFLARRRVEYYRQVHPAGQWAYFTDLDEFPSHEAFDAVKKRRGPYVAGEWLDRIAADGACRPVDASLTLDEQFPMCCRARSLMRLGTRCAYIAAPFAQYSHHPSACRLGRRAWKDRKVRRHLLHHFKWQGNVVQRLTDRKRRVIAAGIRSQPGHVKRQLAYIERHHGFPVAHLKPAPKIGC
jgi:hypothetical protein